MKKKLLLIALSVVFAVQLLVPAVTIVRKYDVLRTGEEYKFRVYPVDPYDIFLGRYVSFNVAKRNYGSGKYGLLTVGEDGYAAVSEVTDEKPESGDYVKSNDDEYFLLPFDRYYMDEKLAPRAEALTGWNSKRVVYVTVRIKNGSSVVSGLYIDGVAIEDYIKNESE